MGRIVNQPFLTGKSNNFLLLKNTYRNQPYILKVFSGLPHPYLHMHLTQVISQACEVT